VTPGRTRSPASTVERIPKTCGWSALPAASLATSRTTA
jgi:hypothetical protein